jgi:eukaryotic-like serine/threonine-protein kinase
VRDVASQLGVRAIVTGSVQRIGDDIAVRVDVVDARDDRQLGGGQYRRKASDIEAVRNDIVKATVEQIKVKLTDGQSQRLTEKSTENSEAYRNYLAGLAADDGTPDGNKKAAAYFDKALELDPEFAAAYVERAFLHYVETNIISDPEKEMPKAKAAIEKALELDGNLAKAHAVRAMVYEYDFDWASADREYLRAIELSPNMDFVRNNYAAFLSILDRQDEALAQIEELRIRDPLNPRLMLLYKAGVLIQGRRFDEALDAFRQAQAVEPSKEVPPFILGYTHAGKGLHNEATTYYKKSIADLGGEEKYSQPLVYLAISYAKLPGKRDEARAILTRIENMDVYVSPALLAAIYTSLDDNDKAMELLERAYIKHDPLLRYIKTAYEYDSLRNDPRFVDLIRRIGIG